MKVFLCCCLSVLLAVVNSQPRPTGPSPVISEPRGQAFLSSEPIRPIVAARPVVDDEISSIVAECNRRISINSSMAHYVQVPSDCSAYAACEFPDTGVQPAVVLCPAGLFFNDDMDVMACVRPVDANCRESVGNPCAGLPDGYNQDVVRTQVTQGAYYQCSNGQTVGGGWCDPGYQYLKFDEPCFPISDRPIPIPPLRDPILCHLVAVQGDSNMFLLGGVEMACAGNTQFNQALCRCE